MKEMASEVQTKRQVLANETAASFEPSMQSACLLCTFLQENCFGLLWQNVIDQSQNSVCTIILIVKHKLHVAS